MGPWQGNFPQWAPVWAAVRGLHSTAFGDAVVMVPAGASVPPQYVATWPGGDTPRAAAAVADLSGARLTLVTGDEETAASFAAGYGLAPLSRLALLAADPADLPQMPQLPDGAELTLISEPARRSVEITASGGPVAHGKLALGDGFAVLGGIDIRRADPDHTMEAAILAALAAEAAERDAVLVLLPALPKSALWYGRHGWSAAAQILTFMSSRDPA